MENTFRFRNDYDEIYFSAAKGLILWLGHLKIHEEDRRKITINYKISYDFGETIEWHTFHGTRVD